MIIIEYVDKVTADLNEKMEQGLLEYETSHGIDVNYKRFSLVLKKDHDVVGIINAFHSYNSIHIEDMWVDSAQRGKGYGRKLIKALGDHFKGKGVNNINLVTCAFQAPDFYRKCGFKEEFVRANQQNPKLTMIFFVKFFDEH